MVDGRPDVGQTDGHRRTVSDHNSSLSIPCSCELKIVGIELWFLDAALLHNVTYLCMKFDTFEVMPGTRFRDAQRDRDELTDIQGDSIISPAPKLRFWG